MDIETKSTELIKKFPNPNLFIVSAVLHTKDGQYLLQLRDDKPGLPLRDHWAFFGGEVEPGEAADDAVIREVEEELRYSPNNCSWFHEAIYVLPLHHRNVVRKAYYLIQIEREEIESMVLCEGTDLKLMSVTEILALERVAPWDIAVVLLHAREDIIYQP